jgi:AcrR family transcriptional regulator
MSALARQDRRQRRHEETRREILEEAWAMARREGLASLSLRQLARAVGMEPQSLYTYFASKHAIYDAMFAQGNEALLARRADIDVDSDPVDALRQMAHGFVEFCTEDTTRYSLMFQRSIPGFEPSPESYALAQRVLDIGRERLAALGVKDQAGLDLYTALISGLVSQQISNDPGGSRWTRHTDRLMDMYLREVAGIDLPRTKNGTTRKQSSGGARSRPSRDR